jgi:DNA-binding CsgD family transcriptional regulator
MLQSFEFLLVPWGKRLASLRLQPWRRAVVTSFPTNFISDSSWSAIVTSLGLSGRESQIARMILGDASEAAIASMLAISPHTVHTHLERLCRKLRVTSRCQVAVRIFQQYVLLAEAGTVRFTAGAMEPRCR